MVQIRKSVFALEIEDQVHFTNLSIYNVDEDFFLTELGRQTLPFKHQLEPMSTTFWV